MCPRVIRSIRTAGAAGAAEEYSAKEVRRRSGLLKRQPASRIEYRCGQSSGAKFRGRLRFIPRLDDDLNERRRGEEVAGRELPSKGNRTLSFQPGAAEQRGN